MFLIRWTKSIFCSKIKHVSAYYENVDFVFFRSIL